MAEPNRITGTDDSALDALLSTLTEPGEDPAFRARVLSRLEGSPGEARASLPLRWAVAGALLAAALVVATIYPWRPAGPAEADATVVAEATADPNVAFPAPAAPAYSNGVPVAGARPGSGSPVESATVRRSPATSRARVQPAGRGARALDDVLPYGLERGPLGPPCVPPVAPPEVREDPMMAALAPPEPVRVDPIDIAEIAPRR